MKYPVFDLHCDTCYALLGESLLECGSLRKNKGHIDLERAGQLAGYAQCFACFTTTLECKIDPVVLFEREIATVMREIEKNSDKILLAYNASDIKQHQETNKFSGILTIEGPSGFGFDPGLLDYLYLAGFRMTNLCWNESNPLTGSHSTGEGLTGIGREYVRSAQKNGMIVDVSHISAKGFWGVIEASDKPVIASHSNSAALCEHSRNLTDDMFRAICETGGVVGINLYADFLGESVSLDTVCDHIFHFMEMDPEAKHICLGGDLDGCDKLPQGFTGVQDYNLLSDRLAQRGLSEKEIMNIFWNNAWGVFDKCCI